MLVLNWPRVTASYCRALASLGGGEARGRTSPNDTLQGVIPERKNVCGRRIVEKRGRTGKKKVRPGDTLKGVTQSLE